MTPKEFNNKIVTMTNESKVFMERYGPIVAVKIAVSDFKRNFQTESFDGKKWQEVQRRIKETKANRYAAKHHPARTKRKILTGDTADLGRSIDIKEVGGGRATIWTDPGVFGGKEPYGDVHNSGGKAGRGSGFTMPQRQFIGDTAELRDKTIKELEKQMSRILK